MYVNSTMFLNELKKQLGIESDEELYLFLEEVLEAMESDPKYPEGECYFCHKETTNWDFCHGCKEYVCSTCMGDPNLVPFHEHNVIEHKVIFN
jgi:methionyl-tRNA synthetase